MSQPPWVSVFLSEKWELSLKGRTGSRTLWKQDGRTQRRTLVDGRPGQPRVGSCYWRLAPGSKEGFHSCPPIRKPSRPLGTPRGLSERLSPQPSLSAGRQRRAPWARKAREGRGGALGGGRKCPLRLWGREGPPGDSPSRAHLLTLPAPPLTSFKPPRDVPFSRPFLAQIRSSPTSPPALVFLSSLHSASRLGAGYYLLCVGVSGQWQVPGLMAPT